MKIEGHLNIIEQEVKSLRARLKDSVEVVRCKDCKHWNRDEEYCVDFLTQDKNGFCSWWERRTDDGIRKPNKN